MKFSIQNQRSLAGNDVSVTVDVEGGKPLTRVTTSLDGFELGDDELDPPSVSYERLFLQAGDASPHLEHSLVVTVTDVDGNEFSANRRWEDAT
jgi:hypothetical protein